MLKTLMSWFRRQEQKKWLTQEGRSKDPEHGFRDQVMECDLLIEETPRQDTEVKQLEKEFLATLSQNENLLKRYDDLMQRMSQTEIGSPNYKEERKRQQEELRNILKELESM